MSVLGNIIKKTATGFLVSTATALAVKGISSTLKMSDSKVAQILGFGIPMMMWVASDDLGISDHLFKNSKKKGKKKKSKREAEDDFFRTFGEKGRAINKAIAEQTGSAEEEVNGVMSQFLPTFENAIAEEDPEDAGALSGMFRKEADDIKKKSPSLGRMMATATF